MNGNIKLKAVDHIGITVPDLDEAVDFFVDVFGCEVVFYSGPYNDVGYTWIDESEPEKVSIRLAMLTQGGTTNFELLEYNTPANAYDKNPPRPTERGGGHIAFYIEKIEKFVEYLETRDDIYFLGKLGKEEGGPIDGMDWIYCLTKWGLVIELLRWEPGTLPYENSTSVRIVPPPWLK